MRRTPSQLAPKEGCKEGLAWRKKAAEGKKERKKVHVVVSLTSDFFLVLALILALALAFAFWGCSGGRET